MKKKGFRRETIDSILDDKIDPSNLSADEQAQWIDVQKQLEDINLSFKGKYYDLKNGDKVTVSLKNNGTLNNFKSGQKTFTVKGLKKTKEISTDNILKKFKIKAIGVDGKGRLAVQSSDSQYVGTDSTATVKNNGTLKNWDVVNVKLPTSIFKDNSGKIQYKGPHSIKYKVSGLIDNKSITNVDDISKTTDTVIGDYVKDKEEFNDKYNSKFLNLYAIPAGTDDASDTSFSDGSNEEDSISSTV